MSSPLSYGRWPSPLTADKLTQSSVKYREIAWQENRLFWVEGRPRDGGRQVIVELDSHGERVDWNPAPFNVRSRVHEYGGGAFLPTRRGIFFVNDDDQQIYRMEGPGATPKPVSQIPGVRFADLQLDDFRSEIICIAEDHREKGEAKNTLCALSLESGKMRTLAEGANFYSFPRLSADGKQLAWTSWNHPHMPWETTELWVTAYDGSPKEPRRVAGGEGESVFQPQWSPEGQLYFVSDRSQWWNLYRLEGEKAVAVYPLDAEFGLPQWVFGQSTYGFQSAEKIIALYWKDGFAHLCEIHTKEGSLREIETKHNYIAQLQVSGSRVAYLGGGPTQPTTLTYLSTEDYKPHSPCPLEPALSLEDISCAQSITFPTTGGGEAHGFYYPPKNSKYVGPSGEKPPCLVLSHGGPTGATAGVFDLGIQFWTTRGFAVVDVNYRGSTGYGRPYREALFGQWGIYDVDDCEAAALFLARKGWVDKDRLAIRGGSAGGFTTLCALTFRDTFHAGASYYGVSDLEALMADTHKFESRYDQSLIGPSDVIIERCRERSPILHVEQLNCPVIFFQGQEDKVVPPNQAERMVSSLKAKGVTVEYLAFEKEQHGFRRSENIEAALNHELAFYQQVLCQSP